MLQTRKQSKPLQVLTSSANQVHLISSTWLLLTILIPMEALTVYLVFTMTEFFVFCMTVYKFGLIELLELWQKLFVISEDICLGLGRP